MAVLQVLRLAITARSMAFICDGIAKTAFPPLRTAEQRMPFRNFLARIRKLLPLESDIHYASISKSMESGALRQPVQPMSDRELAEAIAEFRKTVPSAASRKTLGIAFNAEKKRN